MRSRLLVAALGAATCLAANVPATASAQQYQRGAAYAEWSMPGPLFTNWEQDITVTDNATGTFWNIYWTKVYGPDGYLGIQRLSDGNWFLFSMWGATAWQLPDTPGSTCRTFTEAGNYGYTGGRQCMTPVGTSIQDRRIRLSLIKSNRTNDNDWWWSAWANIEGVGGKYLGQLKAPHGGWLQRASNFHEYFGPGNGWNGSTCVPPGPPHSSAVFGAPTVSSPLMVTHTRPLSSTSTNTCPGAAGTAVPFLSGAYTHLGDV